MRVSCPGSREPTRAVRRCRKRVRGPECRTAPYATCGARDRVGRRVGPGRACVERLRAEGMPVLAADVDDERARRSRAPTSGTAFRHTDVTDAASRRRRRRAGGRALARGPAAERRLRGDRPARAASRQARPAQRRPLRDGGHRQPPRDVPAPAQRRAAMAENEPIGRRARRARQHRVGRGLRGTDRPDRLLGVQGRRGRPDAARRARPRRSTASACARSRRGCSTRRCSRRCPTTRRRSARVPFPPRFGRPQEFADLVVAIARTRC